jgi:hypothetical protein
MSVQGERLSVNDAAAYMFHIEFEKCVQEEYLKLDQIYNTDKSGLFWEGLQQERNREVCSQA